jgi:hypothetical protein
MRHELIVRIAIFDLMSSAGRDMHAIPRTETIHSAFQENLCASFHDCYSFAEFVKVVRQICPGRKRRCASTEPRGAAFFRNKRSQHHSGW